MKILELRLTAFGPFTDRVLDLSAGHQGLHVVFGPNEAGKSSALRALQALLYGIPGQTDDAFLHPYGDLRIGGRLRLSSGDEITFARRKANKGSLLRPDDTRLDDRALDRFLGGVGPDQFRTFWGIDYARLVEGGREILEGRGDLGASLFAAGSGVSHLGALRKRLEDEVAALFAPRAQSRPVNQAIGHLRDLRREQREATVSAEAWVDQDRAARDADKQVTQLTLDSQELAREKARLERLKRVLPLLAERAEVRRRSDGLAEAVLLAPDFSKRRLDAEAAFRTAQHDLARVMEQIREQEAIVAHLGATPPLIAESDPVNELHKSLGSHRKALSDRPRLVGQRYEQRTLAKRLLGELRPDLDIEAVEALRLFVGRRTRIQKLAGERERLDERLASAQRRHQNALAQAAALAADASSLPPPRDPEKLVAALDEARRRGDAESERDKFALTIQRNVTQQDAALEKLGLLEAVTGKLDELPIPSAAAIARFVRGADELSGETRSANSERQRLTKRTREVDANIEILRTKKFVPTLEDLHAARVRRDDAFGLLRDQWEKGLHVVAAARALLGEGALIDLYPLSVTAADDVADRLRSEADRVAELAQYLDERERLVRESEELDSTSQRTAAAVEALDAEWRELWRPFVGHPPQIHDAVTWRDDFGRLRELTQSILDARAQHNELDTWIQRQVSSVGVAIAALELTALPTGGLSVVAVAAEKVRQRVEKDERTQADHARKTREIEGEIRDADGAVSTARADIETWQGKWSEATRGLVDDGTPPPDDALVAVDTIEKILRAIDEASGYDARIAGIDRDAESFRADVLALAERLGETPAITEGSHDTWVEGLHRRLALAVQEDERRRQAHERLEHLRRDVTLAKEAHTAALLTLSALRAEARCGPDDDLGTVEQRSTDLRTCHTELARIEKELVRGGDGQSIADLETEAFNADKNAINVRLAEIEAELPVLESSLSGIRDARASAQAELRRMQGPSVAEQKAEDVQATLAQLREDVVRYARLRVALTLLARRIDDYRHKNQAPLLLRAGTLFREMTLSSFERLEADVEDERPILVGVRPNGTRVPSHGMSEGTRDQLFFALRLAAVEASCASSEPMPFVVDDVLVQFDDDRGAATLRVLADVASRTQVVLFTHHGHVRACAEALAESGSVIVHML